MNIYRILVLFVFSALFFINPSFSEEIGLVDEQKIQARVKALDAAKDMNDELKQKILGLYSKTLANIDSINTYNQQIVFFNKERINSPAEIKKLEQKLQQQDTKLIIEKTPEVLEKDILNIELIVLQQKLRSEMANLTALEAKKSNLMQLLEDEIGSAPTIRKHIIESNHTLEQLLEDRKFPFSGNSEEEKKAQKWVLESHILSLRNELKMLDQKLISQPLRLKLLKLKNDFVSLKIKKVNQQVSVYKKQVDLKRSTEIKINQEITRDEQIKSQGKHPLIQSLAKLNTLLSKDINDKTNNLIKIESDEEFSNKETKRLLDEFVSTKKKLNVAGLNQVMGQMLQEQVRLLPDSKLYLKRLDKRVAVVAKASLDNLQYQDELKKIKNKSEYIAHWMKDVSPDIQTKMQDDLIELVNTRTTLLKKVIITESSYLKALGDLDFSEQKLLKASDKFSQLLAKHMFWLRSASMINMDNIKNIPGQLNFYLSPEKWQEFIKDFIHMLQYSPVIYPVVMLIIILLLLKKRRVVELLLNTGIKTKRISTDSLRHTLKGILYTFLLAIPFPGLLLLTGHQLTKMVYVSEFSHAISAGLTLIAMPLFSLQFFRYMCLPGGLAEVHFKWSNELISSLRKSLFRMMLTLVPAIFITAVLTMSKDVADVNGGLGRLALFIVLIAFAIFFYRILKSGTGVFAPIAKKYPNGFFARYQNLWLIIALLCVASLVGLTIVGYVFTTGQLTVSLMKTLWLIFALILLQQLSLRWLLLTQRKYALRLAFEKRKALQALKHKDETELENKEHIIDVEEPEINMASLSEESKKLLNFMLFIFAVSGLYFIWNNVFPAMSIFESVELWHRKNIVDGVEKLLPVTLSDVFFAIMIIVATLVGGKRLPAIIEILMLQANVNSGNRYTITTLINYTIIGVGFFVIFNVLGADWSQFQWLFAALSVGIGFGLQEIVANFISGIIILFERPIRVGDYVSVGDNEGVVSKIRIRATTIMTRDRKELLVPNKEFITGQLLNWSLSDPTARLILPIGVAYGTDVALARKMLLEAAYEHERVSTEPAPQVIFFGFGDNTLDLQLRCFIPDMSFRLRTISELNEIINHKFNLEKINIAFPQRDVHLDISQPVDIRLHGKTI